MFKHITSKHLLILALAVIMLSAEDTHKVQQTIPAVQPHVAAVPQSAAAQTHANAVPSNVPHQAPSSVPHQAQTIQPIPAPTPAPTPTPTPSVTQQPILLPPNYQSHQGPTIPIEPFIPSSPESYQFQSSPTAAGEEIALQQQQQRHETEERDAQISTWIVQEMKEYQNQPKNIISQSFNMVIPAGEEVVYKWDPSKSKELRLNILVYELSNTGDVSFIRQGEQDEYVEVFLRNEGKTVYTHLGNVYINRLFRVNFDTDYKYLRLVNKNPFMVALTVDVESPEAVPPSTTVSDTHLSLPAQKLAGIHKQMMSGEVSREHQYKYEWGFEQKQLTHDSRLLGLTAVELVIILATGIVQMYFVKSLLDNRAVV